MLPKKYNQVYLIHFCIFLFVGLFGILTIRSDNIIQEMVGIILNKSILVTDYMYTNGISATLLNSSITSMLILYLYKINNINPNGSMIASLWLILGFSMMGKNFINIWPTIIGVYVYSKIQNEPFANYILIAVLSTAFAPLPLEILSTFSINIHFTFIISWGISISLGIILPPLAKFTLKIHQGYNLYNIGFANGLIALTIISIFKYFGIEFNTNFLWSTNYKTELIILLSSLFTFLIILGINKNSVSNFNKILKHAGRTVTDYYIMYDSSAFLNMGILGFLLLLYILIVGGDLNGVVSAMILGVVGFGSLGKHPFNITPLMLGVILASLVKNIPINKPSIILSTIGVTSIAPIAGKFGFTTGVFSGAIHLILISNIGNIGGGINLYNNGFIAGIVAMILIPIIDGIKRGD